MSQGARSACLGPYAPENAVDHIVWMLRVESERVEVFLFQCANAVFTGFLIAGRSHCGLGSRRGVPHQAGNEQRRMQRLDSRAAVGGGSGGFRRCDASETGDDDGPVSRRGLHDPRNFADGG